MTSYHYQGLKNGDRKAIEEIYAQALPQVSRWIKQNAGSAEDGMDVFQETLETIILKISEEPDNFGGLLMSIAKRKWIDRLRKKSSVSKVRYEELQRQIGEASYDEDLADRERAYVKHKLLERTFLNISSLCQQLLGMLKKGNSVTQVVEAMGLSNANTLYRRKAACISRWSELVKADADYKLLNG